MKISLRQLNQGYQPLQSIAANEFPAKLAYRLGRIVAACNSEMERYRTAVNDLVKKHGTGDDVKGWHVEPQTEAMLAFTNETEELLAVEVEFWGNPIQLDEIEAHAKLKPADLAWLDWLIVDGEAEEKPRAKTKLRAVKSAEVA